MRAHDGHLRLDAEYTASGFGGTFKLYFRQNERLVENYSIGLRYVDAAVTAMIIRVNGPHGAHRNPDGTIVTGPHVHHYPLSECDARPMLARHDLPHAMPAPAPLMDIERGWEAMKNAARLAENLLLDAAVGRMPTGRQSQLDFDVDEDVDDDDDDDNG